MSGNIEKEFGFYENEKKKKEEKDKEQEKIKKERLKMWLKIEKDHLKDKIKKLISDIEFDIKHWKKINSSFLEQVRDIVDTTELSYNEVTEILWKIDEILNITKKEKIIPDHLLFSKQDYLEALENKEKREKLLKKIDGILTYTSDKLEPMDNFMLLMGYCFLVDKNSKISLVHDNCIDIKDNLEKLS